MTMNVYFVTYEGVAVHGIALLSYLLMERGASVHYLGDTHSYIRSKEGMLITPNVSIDQFDVNACDALIVPGGRPEGFTSIDWLGDLLRTACTKNVLIGAICAATQTLAVHGLLEGKQYTSSFNLSVIPEAHDSHNTKAVVQRDGNIITARGQGFLEFAVEVLCTLELCDKIEKNSLLKRYRPKGRKMPWKLKPYIECQWK